MRRFLLPDSIDLKEASDPMHIFADVIKRELLVPPGPVGLMERQSNAPATVILLQSLDSLANA
jgi:hypothetical protein